MSRKTLYVGIDVSTAHPNRKVFDFAAVGIDADGETELRLASVTDPGQTWWDVVAFLGARTAIRGAPAHVRSDNGPEFISAAVTKWCEESGTGRSPSIRHHRGRTG